MAYFLYSSSSSSDSEMKQADLTSQITGSNQSYTLPEDYVSGSLRVYWNGVRQVVGESFSEHNATVFNTVFTAESGDFITVDYVAG
tara:strand:- start:1099 stop:1356 length:258 start_codon:yes stop_codon:yes gene_type:complete